MIKLPPASTIPTTVVQRVGLAGLYVFAFGAWLGVALANAGLLLMLVAAALDWRRLHTELRASYWPWLALASVLALGLSTAQGMHADADVPVKHIDAARRLALLWLFLLVAWWLAGDTKRIAIALLLASAGFVLGRLTSLDHEGQLRILTPGHRPGFGLPTLAFAQYTATLLLALCLLGPRILSFARSDATRTVLALAWAGAITIAVTALILAEARMVWIATIAVLVPAIATLFLSTRRVDTNCTAYPHAEASMLIVAAIVLAIVAVNGERVSERIDAEWTSLAPVLSGNLDKAGYGSVGLRAHAWHYAAGLIESRPWFGWGPGASRALFAGHEEPQMHVLPHFHNTPLEFLVTVGIVGALPFFVAFGIAFVLMFKALRRKQLPLDLFLIVVGALALHQLAGLTNSRILNPDWTHLWLLFGGAATTFALHTRNRNQAVTAA